MPPPATPAVGSPAARPSAAAPGRRAAHQDPTQPGHDFPLARPLEPGEVPVRLQECLLDQVRGVQPPSRSVVPISVRQEPGIVAELRQQLAERVEVAGTPTARASSSTVRIASGIAGISSIPDRRAFTIVTAAGRQRRPSPGPVPGRNPFRRARCDPVGSRTPSRDCPDSAEIEKNSKRPIAKGPRDLRLEIVGFLGTISRRIFHRGQFFPQFLRRQLEELPEAQLGQLQAQQAVRRLILAAAGSEPPQVPVQALQVQ